MPSLKLEHPAAQMLFVGGGGNGTGSDPDNSGDNEPPDHDDFGPESGP